MCVFVFHKTLIKIIPKTPFLIFKGIGKFAALSFLLFGVLLFSTGKVKGKVDYLVLKDYPI